MTEPGRWQLAKEDPQSVFGWITGVSFDRREWLIAIVIALVTIFFAFFLHSASVLIVGISGIVGVKYLEQVRQAQARFSQLPEHVEGIDSVAVKLTVLASTNGPELGGDQGWLTVSDGWLIFEGLRTRFALKPNDVESLRPASGLRLTNGQAVEFQARWSGAEKAPTPDLDSVLRAWLTEQSPAGKSIFPPATCHPSELAKDTAAPLILLMIVGSLGTLASIFFAFLRLPTLLCVVILTFWFVRRTRALRQSLKTLPTRTAE